MLIPICREGTRPPFVLVHGVTGALDGTGLIPGLFDTDHPLYFLNARGFDGSTLPYDSVLAMAADYAAEVREALGDRPFRIGGICPGAIPALETARVLRAQGARIGPVVLIDPGPSPRRTPAALRQLAEATKTQAVQQQMYDETLRSLRSQMRGAHLSPFDPNDPRQLRHAATVGVATGLAIARHIPEPYDGPATLILCTSNSYNFFDPRHEWQRVLHRPRTLHILPGDHVAMFGPWIGRLRQMLRWHLRQPIPAS